MSNSPTKKWRVRTLPGFSADYVASEKAVRKKVSQHAERLHTDRRLNRNMLLIKQVVVEAKEGDNWVELEVKSADELVQQHEESLVK